MTGKSPADKNTNFNNFFLIKKVVLRYFVVTYASCNKGGNLQQLLKQKQVSVAHGLFFINC